ncbi:MAG: enoyl-CoA hydratase/isomerase family protein [Dehalococcoidia bacterium]|tara:strand:- start:1673 stop:2440 length:768 start_codon:yes stop_codon:yes gene_type:complete
MDYNNLQIQIDEHIATITLNRPSVLNALSANLTSELHQALDELGENTSVWVIILTGSGRGFCSGADVSEWGKADRPVPTKPLVELGIHIRETPQPVIAAINGIAAGAGLTIAISSDMRIASSDARFSSIFVKRSIVLDTGASYLLPKLVGPGVASEMSLTGNVYDSDWALRVGLVNKVVSPDNLMAEANNMAQDILSNPPLAVQSIKKMLNNEDPDMNRIVKLEVEATALLRKTKDSVEAVDAFKEKRSPIYRGE